MYFYLAMVWKVFKEKATLREHLNLTEDLVFVSKYIVILSSWADRGTRRIRHCFKPQSKFVPQLKFESFLLPSALNINWKSFQYCLAVFLLVT